MELQSQLLAKQHCSKIMRGFSRWSNMVGNLNMTEFGARCIIFILFYVTGGHVVPESTVVRYIRQKLLFFMETTHTHIHTHTHFTGVHVGVLLRLSVRSQRVPQEAVLCCMLATDKDCDEDAQQKGRRFPSIKEPLHHIQKLASNCI